MIFIFTVFPKVNSSSTNNKITSPKKNITKKSAARKPVAVKPNNTSSKSVKKPARYISKIEVLPKNFYKPKKSKQQLNKELENQLSNINAVCKEKTDQKKLLLQRFKNTTDFLEDSLKDPYLNRELAFLFSDILTLLKSQSDMESISSSAFLNQYKNLYNLSENQNDFPHQWASLIYKSIQCSEK